MTNMTNTLYVLNNIKLNKCINIYLFNHNGKAKKK